MHHYHKYSHYLDFACYRQSPDQRNHLGGVVGDELVEVELDVVPLTVGDHSPSLLVSSLSVVG